MNVKNCRLAWVGIGLLVAANTGGWARAADEVRVTTERLATSAGGREVSVKRYSIGAADVVRPGWVVVAGVDPRHRGSVAVADEVGRVLMKEYAGALAHADVFVVSELNPDGMAGSQRETGRNVGAAGVIDADRDGRFNEDPPVDLDGDGKILWMRVKNPAARSGLTAEYVAEEGDPRVMRKADRGKGERAVYALLPECKDADGDGLYGEDGFEGVELDRNFPYHWPEFRDEAGKMALSEPETRGLAEWLIGHPNIVGVVVYAPADNLVHVPPGGKDMDETGEAPATNHVLDADHGVYERIGEKFREITKQKEAPTRDNEGTLQGWAYAQLGVWSFSTSVWVRPDQLKQEEKKEEKKEESKSEKKEDAAKEGEPKPEKVEVPPEKPGPKKIDSEEGKWMSYSDGLASAGKSAGFVDWNAFKHPQLGDVEIGGFLPGFRVDVPESEVARLAGEQAKFVADLLEKTARLVVRPATVEQFGSGVWRVNVEAVNEGKLPTRTAMGVKVRRLPPTRWTIGLDRARVLAGDRVVRMDAVAAGGEIRGSWTITGSAGDKVSITLESPECGTQVVEVVLGAVEKKEGRP